MFVLHFVLSRNLAQIGFFMIYSLNGKIIKKTTDMIVIECSGVGYGCRCSLNTLSKASAIGENQFLFTYLNANDTGVELFGFADEQELNCFKMLISVSSVGPKSALSVLSTLSPERFALCVAAEDIAAFKGIKGVGTKTASRIVLELADKLQKQAGDFGSVDIPAVMGKAGKGNSNASEAVAALAVLGFSQAEAVHAVAGMSADMSAPDMIKAALKKLSNIK
jgi:Holliday junction DNA helicase RuvA